MSVYIQTCTWDEVPHLSEEAKKDLWASTPPYLRDARAKGIPVLGSGLIYPIPDEEIKVPALSSIPADWPRGYGMDVGWNRTAVGWFAKDPKSGVIYLHDYHYQGQEQPAIHAPAIRMRGAWIPGVVDPRSDGRSQIDGKQLFIMYTTPIDKGGYGLDLTKADNAVTTGIAKVWQMLTSGTLKVCENVAPFWKELRMYQTDQNGQVVKKDDHFMDLVRYFCMSGIDRMKTGSEIRDSVSAWNRAFLGHSGYSRISGWMN